RRRSEKRKKNRKISFFELSGEVFEHFLEIREGLKDKEDLKDEELERRIEIEKSFRTIELLLGSNNRIIHFFFIDYDKELSNLKKRDSKSQANYLSAAGTYFQSNNNIFSSKTNAIYFIITKADTIDGENKVEIAADFLREHFGNFYTVIEGRCEEHSIKKPEIKLFSIGDVYFNRISKIDYKYSKNIVETILNEVHPEENNWFKKILSK
ncbi:MAG TPA: hypothetical protein VK021_09390, partial [Flavobacteriaceae bacterium]|nr:hypothetical protein [Flavobacteriaceae bacterium]